MNPIDKEFAQVMDVLDKRLGTIQTQPLTEVEKGQIAFLGFAGIRLQMRTTELAMEEAQRRAESKKIRDVFLRAIDVAYLMPKTKNPAFERVAKAEMIKEYAEVTKRLTDSADVKAQIEIEKQRISNEIEAQRARAEEVQAVMRDVQQLGKPLQVNRPLKLKNK